MIYLQETYEIIDTIIISVYIANTGLDKLPNAMLEHLKLPS